jgi:hypothetical protein
MIQESFACRACNEAVAPGRLSCPHCGTVLAAVAGRRPSEPAHEVGGWVTGASDTAGSTLDPEPIPAPAAADSAQEEPGPAPVLAPPVLTPSPAPWPAATGIPSVLGTVREPDPAVDAMGHAESAAWLDSRQLELDQPAATDALDVSDPQPAPPPAFGATPGAWVPPMPAVLDPGPRPADAPAPFQARAWIGQHGSDEPSATASGGGSQAIVTPGSVFDVSTPGGRPLTAAAVMPAAGPIGGQMAGAGVASAAEERRPFLSIDGARIDDAAGWLVLAGSMATAIGFLVPWSRVVIGSRGAGGYTDTWGLAGPAHGVVFLAAIVVFALAAVRNPVGPWLRTGIAGLVLGSLVFGLLWPYLFGPLGAGPGVMLLVVAALLLFVGGVASAVVHRHAPPPPPV